MSRADLQVNFRMPADLRDALEDSAAQNRRSLSAEIVARLQSSFDLESLADPAKAPGFVITLDARGWPISWTEILAYVGQVQKHGHIEPKSVQVNVLTPKLANSTERDPNYVAIEENLVRFYEKQRQSRQQTAAAAPREAPDLPQEVHVKTSSGKLNTVAIKRVGTNLTEPSESIEEKAGQEGSQLAIEDRLALIKALEATLPENVASHRVPEYSTMRRRKPKSK